MGKNIKVNNNKYHIRSYEYDDLEKVSKLWELAFLKPFSRKYWKWKYHTGPYKNKILLCLDRKGELIVLYGGIPYRFNHEGQEVEVVHLMDIMSHPKHRKTGIFIQTGNAYFDLLCGIKPSDSPFLYGFPGKYHFDIGNKYLCYNELGDGVGFLKAMLGDITNKDKFSSGDVLNIKRVPNRKLDDLWNICKKDYPFSISRNSEFVKWRFCENPLNLYELWGYQLNSKEYLVAYMAVALKGKSVNIIDMLVPNDLFITNRFFRCISSIYLNRGFEEIVGWFPKQHFLTEIALECGFIFSPEPLGIIPTGRTFTPSISLEWVNKNMFYSMGDGDLL